MCCTAVSKEKDKVVQVPMLLREDSLDPFHSILQQARFSIDNRSNIIHMKHQREIAPKSFLFQNLFLRTHLRENR